MFLLKCCAIPIELFATNTMMLQLLTYKERCFNNYHLHQLIYPTYETTITLCFKFCATFLLFFSATLYINTVYKASGNNYTITIYSSPTITAINVVSKNVWVSFTLPVNIGTSTVINYAYSLDNGDSWQLRNPASTVSPLAINNIATNSTYQIKIRAVYDVGPTVLHLLPLHPLSLYCRLPFLISRLQNGNKRFC